MLGAQGIRATGFKRAQGNQHCAKFESHTNRVTFEINAIMMIVKVHPLFCPNSPSNSHIHFSPSGFLHFPRLTKFQLKYIPSMYMGHNNAKKKELKAKVKTAYNPSSAALPINAALLVP